jgi:formate dehydrogenase major subunit
MTNPIKDFRNSDAFFVTGSNTTECHPVMGGFMRRAKKEGKKLIVADPVRIPLADDADVFLQIKPGTTHALSNGMLHVIFKEGLEDKEYIAKHTEGVDELKELVKKYTPEYTAKICGVNADDIVKAARIYGEAKAASILYCMGVTQHVNGVVNVFGLSNLTLACGNLGIPGGGINPIRGQNNVQGACDMGALPILYPGYKFVADEETRKKFEAAWGVDLNPNNGMASTVAIPGALEDKIKMFYITGVDPAISSANELQAKAALKKAFTVVQDIFLTETGKLADVVLPAACFAEKDGTFANSDRTVQRVRKAVPAKGMADWEIFMKLSNYMGYKCFYDTAEDVFNEMRTLTPQYAGITYERIAKNNGLVWPVPTLDHPGTPILHGAGPAKGKGDFKAVEWEASPECDKSEYPILMTTNRLLHHYHTRSMTDKNKAIVELYPDSFIMVHPDDAKGWGISEGDSVKVSSPRGSIKTRAVVTEEVTKGTACMPFHWPEAANVLTCSDVIDPICKIPGLKLAGVKIEKN